MTTTERDRTSLVDQVVSAIFHRLADTSEFDSATIDRLRVVAEAGDLDNADEVERALKTASAGDGNAVT